MIRRYETKLQALRDLVTRAKPTTVANLEGGWQQFAADHPAV